MSFSIKEIKEILSNAGLTERLDEIASDLASKHTADLTNIKNERDQFRATANRLSKIEEELENVKKEHSTDEYKTKWEQEVEAHNALKDKIAKDETNAKKQSAVRALLAEVKIGDKRHDLVLKALAPDMDKIELDKDGKIKDVDALKTSLTTDWADFIETTDKVPATTPTPHVGQVTPLAGLQSQYDAAIARHDHVGAMAIMGQIKQVKTKT